MGELGVAAAPGSDPFSLAEPPTVRRILAAAGLNAYRVLLTRARQGMVIFVPPGDESDPTRVPAFYNDTYAYLTWLGLAEV